MDVTGLELSLLPGQGRQSSAQKPGWKGESLSQRKHEKPKFSQRGRGNKQTIPFEFIKEGESSIF